MRTPFLLRFQELCETEAPSAYCGTQTQTRQHAEEADADPHVAAQSMIPRSALHHAVPIASTTTKTAVRAEADDNDPRSNNVHVIPKCS